MNSSRIRFMIVLGLAALAARAADPVDVLPNESLQGWTRIPWTAVLGLKPDVQWRVDTAQHALICSGKGAHEWLRYDKPLGDFIFQVDWRFTPLGAEEKRYNSGVGVRLSQYGELWVQAQTGLAGGYLFGNNIVDGVMGRFNLSKEMKENRVKPAGEWNHYEIRAQGPKITLSVNGEVVSEATNFVLRRGYIALEAEGYEVTFRNLKLQTLD
jgi:hypothetical protein